MRIAICDDEKIWIDEIETCCKQYFEENHMEYEVDTYTDGRKLIDNAEAYELLLLDVEMPGTDGIMVKEEVIARNKEIRIIFISSYPDNMPEAFGERVMGFLIKPLKYDEFEKKMHQVINFMEADGKFIKIDKIVKKIAVRDVISVKAEDKYSYLYTRDKKEIMVNRTLAECGEALGKAFARCHKSWFVNLKEVKQIRKNVIIMQDNNTIPIGRAFAHDFKEKYDDYLLESGMIWSL